MAPWSPSTSGELDAVRFLLSLLLVPLVFLASAAGEIAHAQSTSDLKGRIVNGTAGAPTPNEFEVTLRYRDAEREVVVRSTGAVNGAFAFTGLPPALGDGYRIETMHQGIAYATDVDDSSASEPVQLTVYETTGDISALAIADSTMILAQGGEDLRVLGILAVVQLENSSDRTFVAVPGEGGPMNLLRFSLPPRADELDVQTFLEGGHLLRVDRGFALTTPIPPGVHDILFTYNAPYDEDTWTFDKGFPLGASVFRVMVADGLGSAQSERMLDLLPVQVGSTRYSVLEARELAPRERLLLELTGLPQPPWWARLRTWVAANLFQRGVAPGILALVLVLVLAFAVARGMRNRAGTPESGAGWEEERRALIERIAHLDTQRSRGDVDDAAYQVERESLKAQLLEIALRVRSL